MRLIYYVNFGSLLLKFVSMPYRVVELIQQSGQRITTLI